MYRQLLSVFIFITMLVCILTNNAHAQQKHPHEIMQISGAGAANPSEVSVAINPTDSANIIAVSLQHKYPDGSSGITNYAYVKSEKESGWKTVSQPNPERRVQGDDAVTFDASGTAYRSYIAFKGLRQHRPEEAVNGIFVSRSTNGGLHWSEPVPVIDHINTVAPFEDKPWLVTDNTESEYKGNIYISWTRFDVYGSSDPADSTHIYFSRSDNGGKSFAMPFIISDHGGNSIDSSNTVEGAVPSVGPNGEVYVAWSGPLGIMFDRSLDGGWTFGKDIHVADDPGGWSMDIKGIGRANGMPVTGTDISSGLHRGRIYINWIDLRNGDPDVFITWSDDRGESWSAPKRVNDDPTGNGAEQFFTWMAVDPTDGSVNIAFYDRRNLEGTETTLTLARSTDGGQTFTNYSVDQESFETNSSIFFGDYIGIDAVNGQVVIAYQHFTSEQSLALSTAIFNFK